MTPRRAVILGISGTELASTEAALFREHLPAGVVLFKRNITDPDQLRRLTDALRKHLPPDAVIAVDQEGGRVARLRPPHWQAHPAAQLLGKLYRRDQVAGRRAAWLTGALIGLDCAAAGFNLVFAPVLDLLHPGMHDVVGDRAYSDDPDTVAVLGTAFAAGVTAAGVLPVVKHAPGHGRATVDSHLALPRIPAGTSMEADLQPFIRCAQLPWMMTAHLLYPDWDADHPATLSPTVLREIIRGRIGFGGVLVSDDLAMGALFGPPDARARAALQAGCDLALFCSGQFADNQAVLAACPMLTASASTRLQRGWARVGASGSMLDPSSLAEERAGLLA